MGTKVNRSKTLVEFWRVNVGEWFLENDDLYVKIHEDNAGINAFGVETDYAETFERDDMVTPVEVEINILR